MLIRYARMLMPSRAMILLLSPAAYMPYDASVSIITPPFRAITLSLIAASCRLPLLIFHDTPPACCWRHDAAMMLIVIAAAATLSIRHAY